MQTRPTDSAHDEIGSLSAIAGTGRGAVRAAHPLRRRRCSPGDASRIEGLGLLSDRHLFLADKTGRPPVHRGVRPSKHALP